MPLFPAWTVVAARPPYHLSPVLSGGMADVEITERDIAVLDAAGVVLSGFRLPATANGLLLPREPRIPSEYPRGSRAADQSDGGTATAPKRARSDQGLGFRNVVGLTLPLGPSLSPADNLGSSGSSSSLARGLALPGQPRDGGSDGAVRETGLDLSAVIATEADSTTPTLRSSSRWVVGTNCGDYITPYNIGEQAQVLVGNATTVLKELSPADLKTVCRILMPGFTETRQKAQKAAARLLCLLPGTISHVVERLCSRRWSPAAVPPQRSREEAAGPDVERVAQDALTVQTREVLAGAVHGDTTEEYVSRLARYRLASVEVGDKGHSAHFVRSVEFLGMTCVRLATGEALNGKLTGLGVKSSFALIHDDVSVGATTFSSHETLCIIGVVFVHPTTGVLHPRLAAAPSQGGHKDGPWTRDLIASTVAEPPLNLTLSRCEQGLVAVGGDGAVARGGEAAAHGSTGACELLWIDVHPQAELKSTEWDCYHRGEVADRRSQELSPMAMEVFDVARVMRSLFGIGQGRVLARAVAADLGVRGATASSISGTRPAMNAHRTAAELIRNFRVYHGGAFSCLDAASCRCHLLVFVCWVVVGPFAVVAFSLSLARVVVSSLACVSAPRLRVREDVPHRCALHRCCLLAFVSLLLWHSVVPFAVVAFRPSCF